MYGLPQACAALGLDHVEDGSTEEVPVRPTVALIEQTSFDLDKVSYRAF